MRRGQCVWVGPGAKRHDDPGSKPEASPKNTAQNESLSGLCSWVRKRVKQALKIPSLLD